VPTRNRRQFPDVFVEIFTGAATTDVTSIAAGGRATVALTIPGVALGDVFIGASTSIDVGNLILSGKVTAADTAQIVLENNTAGAIDPASCTYIGVFGRLNLPLLAT